MNRSYRKFMALGLVGAIATGVALGVARVSSRSFAQQSFGPEDVKSVPKEFLSGGNRNYTVLIEILSESKENRKQLERIDSHLVELNTSLRRISDQLGATHRLLEGLGGERND